MQKLWICAVCGLGLVLGSMGVKGQPLVAGPVLELSEIFGRSADQVEVGDINGDGDIDILVDEGVIVLGDSAGGFQPFRLDQFLTPGLPQFSTRTVALIDLNGDGLDDVVTAGDRELAVFFGDSEQTLRLADFAPLPLSENPASIEVADFDGDGHRDVAAVSRGSQIQLFLNDGSGNLSPAAGIQFSAENIRLSTSGDINNDGIADIAVLDPFADPNEILIFLGDGSGSFVEAEGSGLVFNTTPSGPSRARTIEIIDMDQDGNQDLIGLSSGPSAVAVFKGDGAGSFAEIDSSPFFFSAFERPQFLAAGDLNSDGLPDVVTGNRSGRVSVLLNTGGGSLNPHPLSPFPGEDSISYITLGDFDKDSNIDAITANSSNDLSLFFGNGSGSFLLSPTSPLILDTDANSPRISDLTGNGKPDLLFLRESQDELVFSEGLSDGQFAQIRSFATGDRPSTLAIGDLNDDGNIDAVIGLNEFIEEGLADENGDISILLGDGAGTFTPVDQSALPEDFGTFDLALTEFDGNAPPDLAIRSGAGIRLFSGLGDGTFSVFGLIQITDQSSTSEVLSIDINQDGFQDIVTGFQETSNGPEDLAVYLGSSSGDFTEAASSPVSVANLPVEELTTADFNQDGLPDLATANSDGSVSVLMNTGNTQFDVSTLFSPVSGGGGLLTVGDFNADGNADLFLSFFTGSGNDYQFLTGDGQGAFVADPEGPFSLETTVLGLAADFIDSDNKTDVVALEKTSLIQMRRRSYRIQTLLSTRSQAEIAPEILDFSEIRLGEASAAQAVVISSTGDRDLAVDTVSVTGVNASQFEIESDACSGAVLPPQTDCTISLVFSPSEPGVKEAGLEILSNAESSSLAVALVGEGILVDQPFLDVSPNMVEFGDVAIGSSRNRTTILENGGTAELSLGIVALSGPASNDYMLRIDNCSEVTLAPGEDCSYNIEIEPSAIGLREAIVELPSNAVSSPDQQSYSANGIEAPVINFLPDGFDFGQVAVGTTNTSPDLLVENGGSAELVIDELQLQGADAAEFEIASDDCTGQVLAVGEQCAFAVSFSPNEVGANGPAVAVLSNAIPNPRFFILTGEGVVANPELDLTPNTIDFGNIPTGEASTPTTVTFSNPGAGPLEVTGVGPAEVPFFRAGGTCGAEPFSVPAGGSCTIDYQFQPVDPGSFSQVVAVESDAIAGSDTEFSLAGTSGQFDVAVMKTNTAEFVLPGVATIYDIQVLNLGLSDLFGVEVVDILPPELDATAATWTCTPGTGVTCPMDSGVGDIDELVDLPAGAGMEFTLVAPVIAEEGVDVVNSVTATLPPGIDDEDPANNTATDTDPVAIFAGDFEFTGCSDDLIENRFCVTGENVVLDIVTGLEWRRCAEGRTWDETNQTCTGDPSGIEWDDAVALAPDGGWRLPTVQELSTLRYCSDGDPALFLPGVSGPGTRCDDVMDIIQPTVEPVAFPNWPLNAPTNPPWFWTATDGDDTINDASLVVSFGEGSILNVTVTSELRVLLVRD